MFIRGFCAVQLAVDKRHYSENKKNSRVSGSLSIGTQEHGAGESYDLRSHERRLSSLG